MYVCALYAHVQLQLERFFQDQTFPKIDQFGGQRSCGWLEIKTSSITSRQKKGKIILFSRNFFRVLQNLNVHRARKFILIKKFGHQPHAL